MTQHLSFRAPDELAYGLFELEKNTGLSRTDLMTEALRLLLAQGDEAVFNEKVKRSFETLLGFSGRGELEAAISDYLDSVLPQKLAALQPQALQQSHIGIRKGGPQTPVNDKLSEALTILAEKLETGEDAQLDELAEALRESPITVSQMFSAIGITTKRMRRGGGVRKQFYTVDKLEAVREALRNAQHN